MSYAEVMPAARVWPRVLILALALGGCFTQSSTGGGGDPGWGSGYGGGGGGGSFGCHQDSDCGADVCARDGECLPAADVRMVKVTWTIRGAAANATSCAATPDFYLQFDGPTQNDTFGYTPVPCAAGQFSIDKLPTRFDQVELGVDNRFNDVARIAAATGLATFDLYP